MGENIYGASVYVYVKSINEENRREVKKSKMNFDVRIFLLNVVVRFR